MTLVRCPLSIFCSRGTPPRDVDLFWLNNLVDVGSCSLQSWGENERKRAHVLSTGQIRGFDPQTQHVNLGIVGQSERDRARTRGQPPDLHVCRHTLRHMRQSKHVPHSLTYATVRICARFVRRSCRANMAHMQQPGPDFGLGIQIKLVETL